MLSKNLFLMESFLYKITPNRASNAQDKEYAGFLIGPIGGISSVFSKCIPLPDTPQHLIKSIMSTPLDFRMGFYYRFDLSNGIMMASEQGSGSHASFQFPLSPS